ncbi:hypothetical protein C8R43DRAFT_1131739 [Mycena crocata]|nr:hypothetical protein C8R43DRAFT_1131739 [Mycena crocata]
MVHLSFHIVHGGGAAALQKIRSLYAPPPPENNVASVDGAERRPPNFDSMFGLPANKVTRCSSLSLPPATCLRFISRPPALHAPRQL